MGKVYFRPSPSEAYGLEHIKASTVCLVDRLVGLGPRILPSIANTCVQAPAAALESAASAIMIFAGYLR